MQQEISPSIPTVYTLGYLRSGAMEKLGQLTASGVILLDIRYTPASRRPEWSRKRLEERFGASYSSIHALGNVNYRSHGALPIQLLDIVAGVSLVGFWLERSYDVCLLCACQDVTTCHRAVAAQEIQRRYPCRIEHV